MLFDKILQRGQKVPTAANPLFGLLGLGKTSKTGVDVNEEEALSSSAVWSAITQLSQYVASLPLHYFKRLTEGKEKYLNSPLYNLLHLQPNPEMTSMAYREAQMGQVLALGTCYSEIARNKVGQIIGLWPLLTSRMEVLRGKGNGELFYKYNLADGTHKIFVKDAILRISGFSHSGIVGYRPIEKNMESVGISLALQEYFARFFGDGAVPPAVIEHPETLTQEAQDRLKASWQQSYGGLSGSQRTAILEEGMKLNVFGVTPEQASALESRKFQISEVCRIFNMPPHLLKDLTRSSFANIEQQSLEFVIYTIRPWLVRIEQAYNTQLIQEKFQKKYFFEHSVEGLLRGDFKTRMDGYAIGIQNGWLNADEVRALENLNPQPDGQGKEYHVPMNWIPKDQSGEPPAPLPGKGTFQPKEINEDETKEYWLSKTENRQISEPASEKEKKLDHKKIHGFLRLQNAHYPSFESTLQQIVARETNAVKKGIKTKLKGGGTRDFFKWVEEWYVNHLRTYLESVHQEASNVLGVEPEITPELETFMEDINERFAYNYCEGAKGQIKALLNPKRSEGRKETRADDDIVDDLVERMEEWYAKKSGKMASDEIVRSSNAMSRQTWMNQGVKRVRWTTTGAKNCPFCDGMDGRMIKIRDNFMNAGEVLTVGPTKDDFSIRSADEETRAKKGFLSLKSHGNKAHPPIHKG
jgi:HK97 family phage portal protein